MAGHLTTVAGQIAGQTPVDSSNWSGYADDNRDGNTYSSVTATWTEPAVSCRQGEQSLAAFWVGIDGFSSGTVEQDGTLAQCFDGSAFYYTWWEMFPSNNAQFIGMTVSPGDPIIASVVKNGSSYTLKLTDTANSSDSFLTTQTCTDCADSSAEWIAEAPTDASTGALVQLPDFHVWSPNSASVVSGLNGSVISGFPDDVITMVNSFGEAEAVPTPLSASGNSFQVDWLPTTSVSPGRVRPPGRQPGSPVPVRTPPL